MYMCTPKKSKKIKSVHVQTKKERKKNKKYQKKPKKKQNLNHQSGVQSLQTNL